MRIAGQYQSAASALSCPHEPARSLYIHIPFCFHKCHYCDFYSVVAGDDRHAPFMDALVRELTSLAPHAGPLDTIFVGGGTPTLLAPDLWDRLLACIHDRFDTRGIEEFTVECNPETATPELMATLAEGGVSRLSVGCQSFNEKHLRTLERWHDPASVPQALALAHEAGIRRLSVDLIFGVPGQTLDESLDDLRRALTLSPPIGHLSCYALTVEAGTALAERIRQGDMAPPDERLQAEMYEGVVEYLESQGFARYETSNFARDGEDARPCLHNLAYWRQDGWLAAGPSASGHIRASRGSWRYRNAPRVSDWADAVNDSGFAPVVDLEAPDPNRLARETLMTGVRLAEGVHLASRDLATLGAAARGRLMEAIDQLCRRDQATCSGDRLTLTRAGMLMADAIAADLMECVAE